MKREQIRPRTSFAGFLVVNLILTAGFGGRAIAQERTSASTAKQTPVARTEVVAAPNKSLPFRIEVGEGISSPATEVVLAVKAVTVFHCPEPPMQVLVGDTTGLGLVESIEANDRTDFYLRPTRAGIRTNMWIEMPSATVHVGLRTIAIKEGAATGDYNGEVFVRLPGFREKAESVRARVAAMEKELSHCLSIQEQLKQQNEEEKRRAIAEAEALITDEALAVFAIASFASQKSIKPVKLGIVSVKQVGNAVRIGTRRWWAVLEAENRDKRKTIWVQEISASEGSRVLTKEGRLPRIDPRQRVRFAVVIDYDPNTQSEKGASPPRLNVTIEGHSGEIALTP